MPDIYGADLAMDLPEALILVMQGMAGKAPRVNATNNHWEVYDNDTQSWVDTGVNATGAAGADGEDGHSPYINNTGYWVFWNDSTGAWVTTNYKAAGRDGEDGHSPYIGANGHWFAWSENLAMFDDTGVPAQGPQGETGATGATGTDGYSPVVTITTITGGHRVTITDEDHPSGQSFDVMDGEDGSGGSGDFVLLRMDVNEFVYNGTTAITGAQINTLAATKKAVFLWDEDNARLYTYTEQGLSAGLYNNTAVFVMPWANGNGCSIRVVNAADNDSTYYDRPTLPAVTASDNGKVLGVVNGAWAAKTDEGGGSAPFVIPVTQSGSTYTTTATAAEILAHTDNCVVNMSGAIIYPVVYMVNSSATMIVFEMTDAVNGYVQNVTIQITVQNGTVTIQYYDGRADALPTVSATDNGKFLRVVNGAWAAQAVPFQTPRVAMASTDTTPTLDPNKLYVFPEMASLTITLAAITDNTIVNEYHFVFDSGATATVLTLPASILQPDGFTVEANMHYEISILEGAMTAQGWAVAE